MSAQLTKIEKLAAAATSLPSFPININHIQASVEKILSTFGRDGIFSEYTVHSFDHVADMFKTADWVVTEKTKKILSPADWLMITLSFYFHDLGLVVTKDEFDNREKSGFREFCNKVLFSGDVGQDYKYKVDRLDEIDREKFLYQEFVRGNHARRVRAWIEGRSSDELGFAKAQIAEIDLLLSGLDADFRRDLAMVCESHNLDDIEDVDKYKVSQPYGDSDEETCNLQFCAIILRSVDLLQITRNRAPTVLFRIINPSDPLSQAEWSKQNAVKRVRPQPALDSAGKATKSLQSHTIEVHATFKEDSGFFGLTSYLRYAREEISKCHVAAVKSAKLSIHDFEFPWTNIDDSNVQADGFIKKPFGFVIDQEKILDLLTGHTLYNDSNVVLRELCQNAIDAVRLQHSPSGVPNDEGRVEVIWSSADSELQILDNGTGMTQEVIENHLLKVGSSRYQDPKFREAFPNFSPISRFGIGVLSAFMVADEVEIITVSPEEEYARRISLRSVHGKYLIRLLEKSDNSVRHVGPHGTLFRLKFRQSAEDIDVLKTLKGWVLFPRCSVSVEIDDNGPIKIGYKSPKEALERYLETAGVVRWLGDTQWRVQERSMDGFTLAYAQRYNQHFREWGLMTVSDRNHRQSEEALPPVASCIEGIAVEFSTPGFEGTSLLAVSNATGSTAPRTNVARSAIEGNTDKEELDRKVYTLLMDAVEEESQRLVSEENYSLTWSMDQFPYLLMPALGEGRARSSSPEILEEVLDGVPGFLVENKNGRIRASLNDISTWEGFWTVESQLMRSVEQFVKESKSEVTAGTLLSVSQTASNNLPDGPIVVNFNRTGALFSSLISKFEIIEIVGAINERRLDLRWGLSNGVWFSKEDVRREIFQTGDYQIVSFLQSIVNNQRNSNIFFPTASVNVVGMDDHFALRVYGNIFVMPGNPISDLFLNYQLVGNEVDELKSLLAMVEAIAGASEGDLLHPILVERLYRQMEDHVPATVLEKKEALLSAIAELGSKAQIFNPLAWGKRAGPSYDIEF